MHKDYPWLKTRFGMILLQYFKHQQKLEITNIIIIYNKELKPHYFFLVFSVETKGRNIMHKINSKLQKQRGDGRSKFYLLQKYF